MTRWRPGSQAEGPCDDHRWGVRVFGLVDSVAGRVGYVASRQAQVVVGVKEGRKRETMSVGLVLRGAMAVLLGWRACVSLSHG